MRVLLKKSSGIAFIRNKILDRSGAPFLSTFSEICLTPSATPVSYPFKDWAENRESTKQNIISRNVVANVDRVLQLHAQYKALSSTVSLLREKRNLLSKRNDPSDRRQCQELKGSLQTAEEELKTVKNSLYKEASFIPNHTHENSPIGDESCNKVLYQSFCPANFPLPSTPPQNHVTIGERLGILDLNAGIRTSGSGFFFWKNQGLLLELALIQYALRLSSSRGFVPVMTPDIIRTAFIDRCGFVPRSAGPNDNSDEEPSHHHNSVYSISNFSPQSGMFLTSI